MSQLPKWLWNQTGFDSKGLTEDIDQLIIAVVRLLCKDMPIIPYMGVVFPFMVLLSLDRFLFLDDFEENDGSYISMKSGCHGN